MKQNYVKPFVIVISIAIISTVIFFLVGSEPKPIKRDHSRIELDDEEYLVYPSDSIGRWNIKFPNGDLKTELTPGQIGYFFDEGDIPYDTTWVIHPQSEYQLFIEEDYIVLYDFQRIVAKIDLNKAGELGKALIKDNY